MYKAKWEFMRIEDADYWIKSYNEWAKSVNDRLDGDTRYSLEPEWSGCIHVTLTRFPKSCLVFRLRCSKKLGVIFINGFKRGWHGTIEKSRLCLANPENVRWGGWRLDPSSAREERYFDQPHHGA